MQDDEKKKADTARYSATYRAKDPERRREQVRRSMRVWRERHPDDPKESPEAKSERARLLLLRRRAQIRELLGNQCAGCGYGEDPDDEQDLLFIDHIHGGGGKHRAKVSPQRYLRMVLQDLIWGSTEYQLLCPVCHALKTLAEQRDWWERRRG